MSRSAQSLKSNTQSSTVLSDVSNGRPRHEMLYEDSKIRLERQRKRAEENPPKPSEPFATSPRMGHDSTWGRAGNPPSDTYSPNCLSYMGRVDGSEGQDQFADLHLDRGSGGFGRDGQQQQPAPMRRFSQHRKFDADRTDALYYDAQRRKEALQRRIEAENREKSSRAAKPDLSVHYSNGKRRSFTDNARSQAALSFSPPSPPLPNENGGGSGGGVSCSGSSASTDERFDRLYADAARRQEKRLEATAARAAAHSHHPEISTSQTRKTGGLGGAKRFDALFEESAQRDMKLAAKQASALNPKSSFLCPTIACDIFSFDPLM